MEFYCHDVHKDVLIISADGGLNRSTSAQFTDEILQLIETGLTKIVVDCERLTFISSFGLAVLLNLHKRAARNGGQVKIANVHNRVVSVLKVAHLNKIFQIYPDVDRALLDFQPKQ